MRARLRGKIATRLGLVVLLAATVGLIQRGDMPGAPERGGIELAADAETIKQTEVEAVATARRTGRAIEVGAFRGERKEVWANPDGTFTDLNHIKPFRTVKQGKWVPVDASLERNADGTFSPRAATVALKLSAGGDGPFLRASKAGRSLSLSWPGKLPKPTIDGDSATYAEIVPGVDLIVTAGVSGFSHVFVVKNRAAANRPEIRDLALGLQTKGLTVSDTGEGRLVLADAVTHGRVFETPTPGMWDSGEPVAGEQRAVVPGQDKPSRVAPPKAREAKLGVRLAADRLHLTPDHKLLDDPATRFPVYIDPVFQSSNNSFWAMVDSGYSDTEYPYFDGAFQTKGDERAGYCPPDPTCNESKIKRLFYNLPSNYAGKIVISAEFQISLLRGWNNTARDISIYRMASGVSASTNWQNQPGGSSWAGAVPQQTKSVGAEQACSSTTRNTAFNVTEAVQYAAQHGVTTTTFGIRAANEGNQQHWKRFCENAVLAVTWNRLPNRPLLADLSQSPGGDCGYGATLVYPDERPRLSATVSDPDHLAVSGDVEDVHAEFRLTWPGQATPLTWMSPAAASGSEFHYTAPASVPINTVISWDVRAYDGRDYGGWSSEGAAKCEFYVDESVPDAPRMSSAEYLDPTGVLVDCAQFANLAWRDGVGHYGTFTFDDINPTSDVVKYWYGIDGNPSPNNVLTPATDGAAVSTRWLPLNEGPHRVTVQSFDRADNPSAVAQCSFRVGPGRQAVAEWDMSEAAGATEAADSRGVAPAVAAAAATFGVEGPHKLGDRAVQLTGAADSYLATTAAGVVDTGKSFSASAWVKLADSTRNQVVLSQDGSGEPGFTLGYNATAGKWFFDAPVTDLDSLGNWRVSAGAHTAEWVHLLAVYNAELKQLSLQVGGQEPVVSPRRSGWSSHGVVQIGRKGTRAGYTEHLNGAVADIALFDRIVVPAEAQQLSSLIPIRRGYWQFNSATTGQSAGLSGAAMTLSGNALIRPSDDLGDPPFIPMMGGGELQLDGDGDYAATVTGVDTSGSFSIVGRVRVASEDAGPAMTVFSQKGVHSSGFVVRRNADNRWEIALPVEDTAGATATTAVDDQVLPSADSVGQQIALVYNAFTNEARLYVDGQLADTARVQHSLSWNATGGLQVGRVFLGDQWSEHFAGGIDDVRIYSGVLDQTTVQLLGQLVELPDL